MLAAVGPPLVAPRRAAEAGPGFSAEGEQLGIAADHVHQSSPAPQPRVLDRMGVAGPNG